MPESEIHRLQRINKRNIQRQMQRMAQVPPQMAICINGIITQAVQGTVGQFQVGAGGKSIRVIAIDEAQMKVEDNLCTVQFEHTLKNVESLKEVENVPAGA